MTRIKVCFWVLCIALTGLWLAADPIHSSVTPFAQTRLSLIFYTGIVAMGAMSVSMILAVRSRSLETGLGGLDKSYRLHKWLGVATLVMAVAHWSWISGQGLFTSIGWIPPQGRQRAAEAASSGLVAMLATLQSPAQLVGLWCFFALVVLVVLALLGWFPYRWFLKTHRVLAIVFLLLVFHSVVLMKTAYWTQPISYVMVVLMAAGSLSAVIVLF